MKLLEWLVAGFTTASTVAHNLRGGANLNDPNGVCRVPGQSTELHQLSQEARNEVLRRLSDELKRRDSKQFLRESSYSAEQDKDSTKRTNSKA